MVKLSLFGPRVSNQRCCCLQPQTIASGEVEAQTHLSPATALTQTAQFTYLARQKAQCLSLTLFLPLLSENYSHAEYERYCHGGDGMLSLSLKKELSLE